MDQRLQMLKRRASVTNDPTDIWYYAQQLERSLGIGELPPLGDAQRKEELTWAEKYIVTLKTSCPHNILKRRNDTWPGLRTAIYPGTGHTWGECIVCSRKVSNHWIDQNNRKLIDG